MTSPHARLIIYDGAEVRAEFLLTRPQTLLGRAADSDIIIDDRLASRLHAIIIEENGVYLLRDNNSRNGTAVNNQKVIETQLRPGDQIRIGGTVMEFIMEGADSESEDFELSWKKEKPKKQRRMWKPSRSLIITFILVVLIIMPLFLWKNFIRPPVKVNRPFQLPYEHELGFMPNGDKNHSRKVEYEFEGGGEALTLYYKVWDVDDEDELDIFLNGEKILDVPPTGSGNWSGERELLLPGSLITAEEGNVVAFVNPRNPANKELWGVSTVRVEEKREFPCDPAMAESAYEVGKAKYESKKIVYANLYESIKRLELCVAYLQNCQTRPDYYTDAVAMLDTAAKELQKELKLHFFQATKYQRMKKYDDAEKELKIIQAMVPDSSEEEHLKAKRELARMQERRTRQGR
ncbi:FHA domain-containing protein [bacterium]|nr:FHA domain-containing protein [candidate division CSSED10-310 bacterium]